ncbi:phage tail assembly protein [Neisseria sp. S1]|uniref:phage tail assembly protein n=1 Tax=Neisseria sp. S1 TaxID=3318354 RepID=UPI003A8ABBF3
MQTIQILDDKTVKVTLSAAIKRGDVEHHTITLRAPVVADLEGLSQELVNLKHTDTVQKVIHKITSPQITRREYMSLSMDDARALNAALDFFSAPPKAKAEMMEALEEAGYLKASESDAATSPE